ncbi:MAG: hypothetical protein K2J39_04020 [Ruminococcus sp.]|nr:hypothetical protein [Ruminococcus sp.]
MGRGYSYNCEKCNYEYDVCVGWGMLFDYTYNKIVHEIKNGVYGDDWKDIFSSQDDLVVNATKYLYTCSCGNCSVEPSLSLYASKDSNKPAPIYVMEYYLQCDYYCIGHYTHICKKCGSEMHKTDSTYKTILQCPKCEHINQPSGFVDWD